MASQETHSPLHHRLSRRRLVLQALGLTAAGLTIGSGAAWAREHLASGTAGQSDLGNMRSQLQQANAAYAELANTNAALEKQLADLQNQLATIAAQNSQLAQALAGLQDENARLQSRIADLQSQLDAAEAQNAVLKELADLYKLLEEIDLDTLVKNGIAAVAAGLGSVAGLAALASSGLILARSLLSRFEQALPDMQAALRWLNSHFREFGDNLELLETSARKIASRAAGGIAAVFGSFISVIITYLPFNVSKQAQETLAITQSLLTALADMLIRAESDSLGKITRRIDDGPEGWKQTLLKPLREQTLTPAERVISALTETQNTFTAMLDDPAGAALARRAVLLEKIADFRARHAL